jgi:hypothetical protein
MFFVEQVVHTGRGENHFTDDWDDWAEAFTSLSAILILPRPPLANVNKPKALVACEE